MLLLYNSTGSRIAKQFYHYRTDVISVSCILLIYIYIYIYIAAEFFPLFYYLSY